MSDVAGARSDMLAGISIGGLVGLLVGLSASPVVGSVLSGVLAIVGAYLGLAGPPGAADAAAARPARRVAAFGLACAVALLGGLVIRANNLLADSPASRVQRWVQAGFTPEQAREAVLFQEIGLASKSWQVKDGTTRSAASALFSSSDASGCANLARSRFAGPDERSRAFEQEGARWAAVARATQSMDSRQRADVQEAVWQLVCG